MAHKGLHARVWDFLVGALAVLGLLSLLVEHTAFGRSNPAVFSAFNLGMLAVFGADAVGRLLLSADKKAYLRSHWFDAIIVLPLLQYLPGVEEDTLFVIARQAVIVVVLVTRSRRAGRLARLLSLRPAQTMVLGFALAIIIGAVLLMLPLASADGRATSLVDALFTSASAVCVTGLAVQDTASHFSVFGQCAILGLIQVGGLGIMAFSVALVLVLRKQMDLRQQAALQDVLEESSLADARRLMKFILVMTLAMEVIGTLLLFAAWRNEFSDPLVALYHAAFHSVSAFCNAGFSTLPNGLLRFRADVPTNAVVCGLIISGGLGFMVMRNLTGAAGSRLPGRDRRAGRLRVQTKVVLLVTAVLIAAGAGAFYLTEGNRLFAGVPRGEAALMSVFQSVTSRTAGFNTCDIGRLSHASLVVTMMLMFIGASPGSTAGGIKTTTLAVLWATFVSGLRNRRNTEIFRRTIPAETVRKAVSLLGFALSVTVIFAGLLMMVEDKRFVDLFFETVSAFGTVGLSTGITSKLSDQGKLLLTALMFAGRLGPLTLAYGFVSGRIAPAYEYAEERVMIG